MNAFEIFKEQLSEDPAEYYYIVRNREGFDLMKCKKSELNESICDLNFTGEYRRTTPVFKSY